MISRNISTSQILGALGNNSRLFGIYKVEEPIDITKTLNVESIIKVDYTDGKKIYQDIINKVPKKFNVCDFVAVPVPSIIGDQQQEIYDVDMAIDKLKEIFKELQEEENKKMGINDEKH